MVTKRVDDGHEGTRKIQGRFPIKDDSKAFSCNMLFQSQIKDGEAENSYSKEDSLSGPQNIPIQFQIKDVATRHEPSFEVGCPGLMPYVSSSSIPRYHPQSEPEIAILRGRALCWLRWSKSSMFATQRSKL